MLYNQLSHLARAHYCHFDCTYLLSGKTSIVSIHLALSYFSFSACSAPVWDHISFAWTLYFSFSSEDIFSLILERMEERKTLVGCLLYTSGPGIICAQIGRSNWKLRPVPWQGIKSTTLWWWDDTPTNWATLTRAAWRTLFSVYDFQIIFRLEYRIVGWPFIIFLI